MSAPRSNRRRRWGRTWLRRGSDPVLTPINLTAGERKSYISFAMNTPRLVAALALSATLTALAQDASPKLTGVGAAMEEMAAKQEIAGAVTVVVNPSCSPLIG